MSNNLNKIYLIQGPDGPERAKRPSDTALSRLRDQDPAAQLDTAQLLTEVGHTIDWVVDTGWDYWKVMNLRRVYGYTWVPSFSNPGVAVAPGLSMLDGSAYDPLKPPIRAILVPPSELEDPNYIDPVIIPSPPPVLEPKAVFGQEITSGKHTGSFQSGLGNDVDEGTTAVRNGREFEWTRVAMTPWGPLYLWTLVEEL